MNGLTNKFLYASLILAVLLPCRTVSAQNCVGGSFSINAGWNLTQNGETLNTSSIGLSPEFGWFIGERWNLGFAPKVGFSSSSSSNNLRSVTAGIAPYARYRFLEFKKFGLWAEGKLAFDYIANKNGPALQSRIVSYGIGIRPVLTYNLTGHISLYGSVNLFSLSLRGYSTYYAETDKWQNSLSFGLSGQSDNVVDSLSEISIGFFYKF